MRMPSGHLKQRKVALKLNVYIRRRSSALFGQRDMAKRQRSPVPSTAPRRLKRHKRLK